ncbi:MAG: FMN-binding protein [Candidatus Paceibacterota bacterium]|jgi:uncharacterized protein with FMN-binding domain
MKKALLSSSLIFVFIAYVLHVRILGAEAPAFLAPQSSKTSVALSLPQYNTNTQTASPKPKPTTASPSPARPPTQNNSAPSTPVPPPPVVDIGKYKNGSYTGTAVDAYYGNVQVKAVIAGGKITDVQFLDYPQDRQNSVRINSYAMPRLTSEAISIQDSNVDTVSGASFTSAAFRESLSSALSQAMI